MTNRSEMLSVTQPLPREERKKARIYCRWYMGAILLLVLTLIGFMNHSYKYPHQRKNSQSGKMQQLQPIHERSLANIAEDENQYDISLLSTDTSAVVLASSPTDESHISSQLQGRTTSLLRGLFSSNEVPSVTRQARGRRVFYAIADMPYSDNEAKLLVKQLQGLNPTYDRVPFMIHLGDIMKPKNCELSDFARVHQILKSHSPIPVLMLPGDNDWKDCPDPENAWLLWKRHFISFENNWGRSFSVYRQRTRRENFAFVHTGVLFIGVNLAGGRIRDQVETEERLKQNLNWTRNILKRNTKSVDAVVIFGHAKRSRYVDDYFDPLLDLIKNDYPDIPFLYLHGDGHRLGKKVIANNVLDVQLDQGKIAPPMKITIPYSEDSSAIRKFIVNRRGGPY